MKTTIEPPGLRTQPATSDDLALPTTRVSGVALGLAAAVGYTLTNIALRKVGTRQDFDWACWVSMHKAAVPTALAWLLCLREYLRGRPAFPAKKLLPGLFAAAFVMQFGGNILFQLALVRVGLAISVPLAFSTIIVTGGVLGKLFLGEPLTKRTVVSMVLVVTAITLLNLGAGEVTKSILGFESWPTTLAGVLAACGSGFSYGFGGVMIRRTVASGAPVYSPVLVISSSGFLILGLIGYFRLGPEVIHEIPVETTRIMWLAGVLNAFSFFSNCFAFQRLPVVKVNLLNATQAAMAAFSGVLLFREQPTLYLVLGTVLTILGLTVLGWTTDRTPEPAHESKS